jgi:hypothetical protein
MVSSVPALSGCLEAELGRRIVPHCFCKVLKKTEPYQSKISTLPACPCHPALMVSHERSAKSPQTTAPYTCYLNPATCQGRTLPAEYSAPFAALPSTPSRRIFVPPSFRARKHRTSSLAGFLCGHTCPRACVPAGRSVAECDYPSQQSRPCRLYPR